MRKTKLGIFSTHNFKGKSLIAFDERWKHFFIGDPTFEAIIENGRLVLYGPKLNLNPHRDHPAAKQEKLNE